jgi:hypothetical protein
MPDFDLAVPARRQSNASGNRVIKAEIIFGGTLFLIWFVVLAVRHVPFGAQLIGAAP